MARRPLTLADREEISRGLARGLTNQEIARSIGRNESVISEEISRHGGRARYRAHIADSEAREARKRPKARKMDADPELNERVRDDLRREWSPEQISGRLVLQRHRGETKLAISHEAIYTWFYAQPKGRLREEGVELRTKREERKPRGRKKTSGAKFAELLLQEVEPPSRSIPSTD
ncbi:MAG: transposase [Actinoallomurus sp.]